MYPTRNLVDLNSVRPKTIALLRRGRISAMHRMPHAYARASQEYNRRFRWQDERDYLAAIDRGAVPSSAATSVLFFGYHRSGSMFASGRVDACGRAAGLKPLNLRGYIVSSDPDRLTELVDGDFWQSSTRTTGHMYGPIRQPIAHTDLNNYKALALFRDPRDALVSHYFSARHAHTLLNERNIAHKEAADRQTIDEFVLSMVPTYLSDLTGMADLLDGMSTKLVTNYDDMMGDYRGWVQSVVDFVGADASKVADVFADGPTPRAETASEDLTAHNRSGRSGQFRTKLKAETISVIEAELGTVGERLGVPLT